MKKYIKMLIHTLTIVCTVLLIVQINSLAYEGYNKRINDFPEIQLYITKLYRGHIENGKLITEERYTPTLFLKLNIENGWSEETFVQMWSLDNRTECFTVSQAELQTNVGWYYEPMVKLYNAENASKYFPQSKVEEQCRKGWSKTKRVIYQSASKGRLTKSGGVFYFNGHKETWYSQKVLPGGGLKIPGRHVAADGTIRDKDNYICIAAHRNLYSYGSIVPTSLGMGKVYDTGCAYGVIDVYVNW